MRECDDCGLSTETKGAVIQGTFKHLCSPCLAKHLRLSQSGAAQYSRDRDRESHRRDTVQPWWNGKPNPEFIQAYPEEAKDYFSKDQLKESER